MVTKLNKLLETPCHPLAAVTLQTDFEGDGGLEFSVRKGRPWVLFKKYNLVLENEGHGFYLRSISLSLQENKSILDPTGPS